MKLINVPSWAPKPYEIWGDLKGPNKLVASVHNFFQIVNNWMIAVLTVFKALQSHLILRAKLNVLEINLISMSILQKNKLRHKAIQWPRPHAYKKKGGFQISQPLYPLNFNCYCLKNLPEKFHMASLEESGFWN